MQNNTVNNPAKNQFQELEDKICSVINGRACYVVPNSEIDSAYKSIKECFSGMEKLRNEYLLNCLEKLEAYKWITVENKHSFDDAISKIRDLTDPINMHECTVRALESSFGPLTKTILGKPEYVKVEDMYSDSEGCDVNNFSSSTSLEDKRDDGDYLLVARKYVKPLTEDEIGNINFSRLNRYRLDVAIDKFYAMLWKRENVISNVSSCFKNYYYPDISNCTIKVTSAAKKGADPFENVTEGGIKKLIKDSLDKLERAKESCSNLCCYNDMILIDTDAVAQYIDCAISILNRGRLQVPIKRNNNNANCRQLVRAITRFFLFDGGIAIDSFDKQPRVLILDEDDSIQSYLADSGQDALQKKIKHLLLPKEIRDEYNLKIKSKCITDEDKSEYEKKINDQVVPRHLLADLDIYYGFDDDYNNKYYMQSRVGCAYQCDDVVGFIDNIVYLLKDKATDEINVKDIVKDEIYRHAMSLELRRRENPCQFIGSIISQSPVPMKKRWLLAKRKQSKPSKIVAPKKVYT